MIESVKIGGITYPISRVDDLRDESQKLDGWIRYRPYSIQLDSGIGEQGERVVLWHEILHGILTQAGISYEDEHESVLDALAYGISQVLQDNPVLGDERSKVTEQVEGE